MLYIDKYHQIRQFVNLNIPHNKKNFTRKEKYNITKYYNDLKSAGYLDRQKEGFILKNISKCKYKVKNLPKLKYTLVNVGTSVIDGKIVTAPDAKIKIINGKIKVKRNGKPYKWEFQYNIRRDWEIKPFIEHLKKRMKPNKIKAGQLFVIGAGIYEMRGTEESDFYALANEILSLANKYQSLVDKGERPENKSPDRFMYTIYVYDNMEAFKIRLKNQKKRKKKSKPKYKCIKCKKSFSDMRDLKVHKCKK